MEIIPIDPDILRIIRLFLERLPVMTTEERSLYVNIVGLLMNLPVLINGDDLARR